ncbi:MAG: DUF805 domain-containing protein [Clostridiales bacterium]|jgi:uncharacterized membrane protein YhaH (DUF805 family)|nr:DUF805 domain-containing protein [Clostridiales bacterium]
MKKYLDIYADIFKNYYAKFKGTETRERFAVFIIGSELIQYILLALAWFTGNAIITLIAIIFLIALIIPTFAILVRRLRGAKLPILLVVLMLFKPLDIILVIYLILAKK